jgi:hypothetical protein
MASIATTYIYPKTDFVAASQVNVFILKQELEDAGVSSNVLDVIEIGTDVQIRLEGNAPDGDDAILDAVVAAHEGGSFSSDFQKQEENLQQDTAADNTEVAVCTLESGVLRAGQYTIEWYGEHRLSDNTAGGSTKLKTFVNKDGSGYGIRAADSKPAHYDWGQTFGKLYFGNIKDGETLDVQLRLQRQGGGLTTETAQGQRMRIFIMRVGD